MNARRGGFSFRSGGSGIVRFAAADREAIVRADAPSAGLGGQRSSVPDNLDVQKLADGDGLWRLRVGAFRAVFQTVRHGCRAASVFRRKEDTDYSFVGPITLVRSAEGLRTLADDVEQPPPVPPSRKPVREPARREPVQNPLSVFTDEELADAGLSETAIVELRRVPAELIPDRVLRRLGVEPTLIRLVAEMWEKPAAFVGKPLSVELGTLEQREAAERLRSEYSASSLVPIDDVQTLLALLDADIEDWMVYLHPSQLERGPTAGRGPVPGSRRCRYREDRGRAPPRAVPRRRDRGFDPAYDLREQSSEGVGTPARDVPEQGSRASAVQDGESDRSSSCTARAVAFGRSPKTRVGAPSSETSGRHGDERSVG